MADQRQYATITEFSTWDDATEYTVPSDSLLRRASGVIDGLTRHSAFLVDVDGYPTDIDVLDVFRDATSAQVAYWEETGDITGAEAQGGSFSIGSVKIGAAGDTSSKQSRIAPEAVQILVNAGLITATTPHS